MTKFSTQKCLHKYPSQQGKPNRFIEIRDLNVLPSFEDRINIFVSN